MQEVGKGMHNPLPVDLHLLLACVRHSGGPQSSESLWKAFRSAPVRGHFESNAGIDALKSIKVGPGRQSSRALLGRFQSEPSLYSCQGCNIEALESLAG